MPRRRELGSGHLRVGSVILPEARKKKSDQDKGQGCPGHWVPGVWLPRQPGRALTLPVGQVRRGNPSAAPRVAADRASFVVLLPSVFPGDPGWVDKCRWTGEQKREAVGERTSGSNPPPPPSPHGGGDDRCEGRLKHGKIPLMRRDVPPPGLNQRASRGRYAQQESGKHVVYEVTGV